MEYWVSLTKIIQSVVTFSAILIGGIWAYYKFARGRIFNSRLEVDIKCKRISSKDNVVYLNVTVTLKNVGLSKVSIDKNATAVRVYKIIELEHANSISDIALESKWESIGIFSLFEDHDWVEPYEVINEQKIIECRSITYSYKIESIVMSKSQEWHSSCISEKEIDLD